MRDSKGWDGYPPEDFLHDSCYIWKVVFISERRKTVSHNGVELDLCAFLGVESLLRSRSSR